MGQSVSGLWTLRGILRKQKRDEDNVRGLRVGVADIEWGIGVEEEGKRNWTLPETVSRLVIPCELESLIANGGCLAGKL
jgi:hypothetical protein